MGRRLPVLVLDGDSGQSRSSLAAVRALAAGGYRPTVAFAARRSLAAASRACERSVRVPPVVDPAYAPAVRAEFALGRYLTLLHTSDASLLALDEPWAHLVDKAAMISRARRVGLEVVPGRAVASIAALEAIADELAYPAVVKPTISGFPPTRVFDSRALAGLSSRRGPFLVQPYISAPLSAVAGVMWDGRLKAAVHSRALRTWPADCGPSCAAETITPDVDVERRLAELLRDYRGIFQAQFLDRCLIDLNLRAYGSLPLAVAAGVNLPALLCDLIRGEPVPQMRAAVGVPYRWLEGDVRNIASGIRDGRMSLVSGTRALRPRRGCAHSVESLRDPGPMLVRLGYVASRSRRPDRTGS